MISVLSQLAKAIPEIFSVIWYYLIRIANNGHCETERFIILKYPRMLDMRGSNWAG